MAERQQLQSGVTNPDVKQKADMSRSGVQMNLSLGVVSEGSLSRQTGCSEIPNISSSSGTHSVSKSFVSIGQKQKYMETSDSLLPTPSARDGRGSYENEILATEAKGVFPTEELAWNFAMTLSVGTEYGAWAFLAKDGRNVTIVCPNGIIEE